MATKQNNLQVVLSILDKATAPLQAFTKQIAAVTAPLRQVGNRLAILNQAAGFGKLTKSAGGIADAFGGVAKEVGSLAVKVTAGIGVVGGALFGLVKMTSDAGDAFDELSTKAGVSAEFFQKAAYAASFASVSTEDLAGSMAKMNSNMIEAIGGGKDQIQWFKRAGLSVADLRKMKPEQVFDRVMESVKKLPKESAKAGALMKGIFGKSGGNLLPMAEGFKELTEEAVRLGLVLSDDAVKAGAEFNDTFDKMMKVIKGVGMMIGSILMPYFKEAIEAVTSWALVNRELIATKVSEWIAKLKENWPEIRQGALDAWAAIQGIVSFIRSSIEFVGGFGNALKIAAAIMAGPLLLSILLLTKAIAAFGLVLLTTPVGWLIGAIALIAGAAYLIYKNWEPIKEFFSNLWAGVTETFDKAMKYILDKIAFVRDAIASAVSWAGSLFSSDNQAAMTAGDGNPDAYKMGAPAGVAPVAAASREVQQPKTNTNNAKVEVDFKNVPRGVEVTPGSKNTAPLDLSMGYSMVTP